MIQSVVASAKGTNQSTKFIHQYNYQLNWENDFYYGESIYVPAQRIRNKFETLRGKKYMVILLI